MNYQGKTKDELIIELRKWQQEYDSLKISSLKDITERKMVEEALKKSIQLLRDTGEMAKVGGWELDISTKETTWTEEVCRIHGVEPGYEPKLEDALNFYAPESRPALEEVLKKATELGEPYDIESFLIPSGSKDKIWVRSLGRAVYSGGKIAKITGTFQNIDKYKLAEAALRESEARFRSLFENSLIGISAASPNGKLIQANLAYARMYGYENPEIMLAEVKNVGIIYAKQADRKEVLQILRLKGFMEAREVEVIRRDGSRFFVLVSACEVRDPEGKLLYNQTTHLDLTQRRKIEEELRKSKELLEKLNRHLYEIRENERAVISREIHDQVGQSMTVLKLDLNQMIKYLTGNPEALMKLKSIISLVSDAIKNVQRISSDLRPGILDDLGLVSAIEWYCDEFEKRTGIKCTLRYNDSDFRDSQINLTFFRVLQETLTNVIRHAMASSVNVKLHKSRKGATLTIQDNGIGIHEEHIESHKSLGLISMRERVRQFNGKIDISSKKGDGTKLTIFIPS